MPNKISAIIPTKNRSIDLEKAIKSILVQSKLPDELIIIDQSDSTESYDLTKALLIQKLLNKYIYILDTTVTSLVSAKKLGVMKASGNIICFLEDDIILEPNYFNNINNGFIYKEDMLGCSGIIINHPKRSFIGQYIFNIFHLGIFRDYRSKYFGANSSFSNELIPCNTLSGGVSAWRKEVFDMIPFDDLNGFHMLEDIDYSTRAAGYFGDRFYINTQAHLSHFSSPVNRDTTGVKFRRKNFEFIIFYKKRSSFPFALVSLVWLLLGLMLDAVAKSLGDRSLAPLKGYFNGVWDGINAEIKLISNE